MAVPTAPPFSWNIGTGNWHWATESSDGDYAAPGADTLVDGNKRKTQAVGSGDDELVGWVAVEVFEGGAGGDDAGGEWLQVDARVLLDLRKPEVEGSRNRQTLASDEFGDFPQGNGGDDKLTLVFEVSEEAQLSGGEAAVQATAPPDENVSVKNGPVQGLASQSREVSKSSRSPWTFTEPSQLLPSGWR